MSPSFYWLQLLQNDQVESSDFEYTCYSAGSSNWTTKKHAEMIGQLIYELFNRKCIDEWTTVIID